MSEDLQVIKFKLIHPDAKPPKRMTSRSIGYDLATVDSKMIFPGESARLETGVQFFFEYPNHIQLQGRSSVFERGLVVHSGLIDPDYKDSVKVLVRNIGKLPIRIEPGDRLMQFVLQRDQVLVAAEGEAEATTVADVERDGGIGSTGKGANE